MQLTFLEGRIIKSNPELRTTQNGKHVCTFTIAINDGWGGNQRTDYWQCVSFGKTAENIAKYFHQKDVIHLTGKFQNNPYKTDEKGFKLQNVQFMIEKFEFPLAPAKQSSNAQQSGADIGTVLDGIENSNDSNDGFTPVSGDGFQTLGDDGDLPF